MSEDTAELLSYAKILSDDPANPDLVPFDVWPSQRERLAEWDQGHSEVILKARQLGFSWVIAGLMLRIAMFSKGTVGVFSLGEREAKEQMERVKVLYDSLPPYLKNPATFKSQEVEFEGQGRIIAFPSTIQAGTSYTFRLVVMDEASKHPYAQQNYGEIRPTISAGSQIIINSTANATLGANGFFYNMYWDSKAGDTGYSAVFVPWNSRPDRDQAWYEREKKAFIGNPRDFYAQYPSTDEEAFVGREGLVYDMFNADFHVVKDHPFKLEDCVRIVAGVDFGGGDPTAVEIWGMNKEQHVHNFAEFYKRGAVAIEDLAAFMAPFKPDTVSCDPSQAISIETLRRLGFNARKANNRRGEGIDIVTFMLQNNRMTHHVSCSNTINEYSGYRWAHRTDPNSKEKYATSTAVDHHADGKDADRYALTEILSSLMKPKRMRSLSGRTMAKAAV